MDLELTGKIALVTAASRGIGRAIAERLAAEGATVIAVSRSGGDEAASLPGKIVNWTEDLDRDGVCETLVDRVLAEFGRLDIAVVNTPGPPLLPLVDTTWQQWQDSHDRLLRPAMQIGTAAGRAMRDAGGGVIVFMTSTWVVQPVEGGGLSAVYRSGVSALSRTLAIELASSGVRVVQVMPGATETDRMRSIIESKSAAHGTSYDDEVQVIADAIPLGHWAQPAEIADVVAFVASPRSSFLTGSAITLDGGAVRATT